MNPLTEAASKIKGHWYQGYYWDNECENYCGLGMVNKVLSDMIGVELYASDKPVEYFDLQRHAFQILGDIVKSEYPGRTNGTDNFVLFNDHEDTTEDEVIAILEKGAAKWDEIHG